MQKEGNVQFLCIFQNARKTLQLSAYDQPIKHIRMQVMHGINRENSFRLE